MKKITKYAILSASIFVISVVYIAFRAEGQIKPYYSGDAVYANGKVIFGSMNNDGVLELFSFSNNAIQRGAVIKSSAALLPRSATKRIYDFALTNEGGKAFVYTAEGKKMSKYDISNINVPVFVKQVVENNGDWYIGIKKYDGRLMTVGTKETKLWNYNLQNIDGFKVLNTRSYNVGISNEGDYIFNIGTTSVSIFDTVVRNYASKLNLKITDNHFRKSYFDDKLNKLFVADDEKLVQVATNGTVTDTYKHISNSGYDVDAVQNSAHVYMTDGLGVIKLNKSNLDQVKWAYTTNANGKKGGWAMGLNVVATDKGEKLVVFNNSNIIVMDSNLKVLGSVDAIEESDVAFIEEPLLIRLDKTDALVNMPVLVSGTGFAYNEEITVTILGKSFLTNADSNGRFKTNITVPGSLPKRADIKATGKASKLTYSTSINIR
ncbi:hypothetical protein L6270_03205 [Candidatus Parcubacteria bacterium]|nr:hypothetical protein [Patescibacteria group bacterium]MBU4308972.1 hypothetical protein [Patescibacteria group bacterium]MBU4431858.1 hypothetical protein [Patescibacteria group bacterium]MBU4577332.1 hypothetical protein [Patescibacteria group bacterium]MCG2697020.1 hypothetical protein [Candidatus Parcubacteria bacterium]